MIRTQTLLVLGAGASKPYGLPLGSELRASVHEWASVGVPSALAELLAAGGSDADEMRDFAVQFRRSSTPSVDRFVSTRPEWSGMGKAALAWLLMQKERPDRFHQFSDGDWYATLWDRMHSDAATAADLNGNRLKVVTFNYDRSLEAFLFLAIKNSFPISDQDAMTALAAVPILHVYGRLGRFGLENVGDGRTYAPEVKRRDMSIGVEQINVMPEAREDSQPFQVARQYFDEADHAIFLGFGFDDLNRRRLGFPSVLENPTLGDPNSKQIFASTFGMRTGEVAAAQRRICAGRRTWTTLDADARECIRSWNVL